ncbi:uncharacterized protein LOC142162332 [Nicotiana tabacum]|uniref:Uncharacterized protein LOC142162332 n=1 Tax=Nicotiana tabacum TaxID=4097 RepID=A0AC58RPY2_TOBAC
MYYLHREIFTLTQGTSSILVYYSKLKDLWDEYDSIMPLPTYCDKSKNYNEHQQYQRLWQFFMGLNEGYSEARSQILMKSKIPTINQAYATILQDESQKIIAGGHCDASNNLDLMALFTSKNAGHKQKKNYSLECDYCHLRVHTKKNCYKLMRCDFCNMKGHLKENYYNIIGYPADFKAKRKGQPMSGNMAQSEGITTTNYTSPSVFTQDQYIQILNMLSKTTIGDTSGHSAHMAGILLSEHKLSCDWIVDTRVTNHMTSNKHLLDDVKIGNNGQVQMPTGHSAKISHVGSC